MKLFNRVCFLVFLVSSAAVFCFGWISDWQMTAHANDMARGNYQAVTLLPGPLQNGFVDSKLQPSDNKAKAYYNRGTVYYQKGNFESAIRYLSMSLALEPKAPDVYFNRGLSYRRQHKIDEAISDFSKAIELNQTQSGYYFERCNAFIVKNDFDDAVADCSEAIKLSPDEVGGYFLRGLAYMLRGDLEGALVDSVQALQIQPDHSDARRLLYETLVKREVMTSTRNSSTGRIQSMKKRFTEEQIAYALRQHESGMSAAEVCRQMGVSEPAFYRWKQKYAGIGTPDLRRLGLSKKRTESSKNW